MTAPGRRLPPLLLVAAAIAVGTVGLVAAALLIPVIVPQTPGTEVFDGTSFYDVQVAVPSNATFDAPFHAVFHGASFVLWWPSLSPSGVPGSGVFGVNATITEPSGLVDHAYTDCGACGQFTDTWFASDHRVGLEWTGSPKELGDVTLLVAS
jgi:hypothetical protein